MRSSNNVILIHSANALKAFAKSYTQKTPCLKPINKYNSLSSGLSMNRLFLLILFLVTLSFGQTRIYVDSAAVGANNGSTWTDAYTNFAAALSAVSGTDTIWVAKGTYTPSVGPRSNSFILPTANAIAIYGGFAGGETALNQRDPKVNKTIFSGDHQHTPGDDTDNLYHVFYVASNLGQHLFNGVTITGGYANGGGNDDNGAGIFNNNSTAGIDFDNVTFIKNYAVNDGAAIYGGALGTASYTIKNSRFINNSSSSGNGAAFASESGGVVNFASNYFENNVAFLKGGAVFVLNDENKRFVNNIFYRNHTDASGADGGGALWINQLGASGLFEFNTVVNNSAPAGTSGGVLISLGTGTNAADNNIFFGNTSFVGGSSDHIANGTYNIGLANNIIPAPITNATDNGGNLNVDPLLADTANGDFRTLLSSQSVDNAGTLTIADFADLDNDGNTVENLPFDFNGDARVIGLGANIGALETVTDPLLVTSTSDANVFGTLRYALNQVVANDTIRFAPNLIDQTITINTALPIITLNNVVVDGDINGDSIPSIRILGNGDFHGFHTTANGVVFKNLNIAGFTGNNRGAIFVAGQTTRVIGNYIGTTLSGQDTTASQNFHGIRITNANNIIGDSIPKLGNVIGGSNIQSNTSSGIRLDGSFATDNTIIGNSIGVFQDSTGVYQITNWYGVSANSSGALAYNQIGKATLTGFGGNTISGNRVGVSLTNTQNNTIQANYIGLAPDGTQFNFTEDNIGISLASSAQNNLVGGHLPSQVNFIDGMRMGGASDGISLSGASLNIIIGNMIGFEADSTAGQGNYSGIHTYSSASNNTIGDGTTAGSNHIGNNERGYVIDNGTATNHFNNNVIGVSPLGSASNTQGIWLEAGARNDTIQNSLIVDGSYSIYVNNTAYDFKFYQNRLYNGSIWFVPGGSPGAQRSVQPPILNSIGADSVVYGQSSPNAFIQIFADDASAGRYPLGTTTANGLGDFNLKVDLDVASNITAMQDSAGSTSNFSAPLASMYVDPFIVTSTSDANVIGTLRYAINEANLSNDADTITFDASLLNSTIVLSSALPSITRDSLYLDGDINGDDLPSISINGNGLVVNGLSLNNSDYSTIKNINFQNFSGASGLNAAIALSVATNNRIVGNYFGTNLSGTDTTGTSLYAGVRVGVNSNFNIIGDSLVNYGNVFSGINGDAIYLRSGASNNVILNNKIGTDLSGTLLLGKRVLPQTGIRIFDTASLNQIGNARPSGRNIIGDINGNGISITGSGTNNNIIQGNYIGVLADGNTAAGNNVGIAIQNGARNNVIGGTASSNSRNVVSGNSQDGIYVYNIDSLEITNNIIGMNAAGNSAVQNISSGIEINDSRYVYVGDLSLNGANYISGNFASGIDLTGTEDSLNVIEGNYIGLQLDQVSPLGNQSSGVGFRNWAHRDTVRNNVIANNGDNSTESGIQILHANVERIVYHNNTFYNNFLKDIYVQAGAQGGITPPTITIVNEDSTVYGTYVDNAASEEIDLYIKTPTSMDFLESPIATAGTWFSNPIDLSLGDSLVAIVRDMNGNTSEFSPAIRAKYADPLIVTSISDANVLGTLRYAINEANSNIGNDTIRFDALIENATIIVNSLPALVDDGTVIDGDINGDNQPSIRIQGVNNSVDIFQINSDLSTLAWLNIGKARRAISMSGSANSNQIYGNYIGLTLNGLDTAASSVENAIYASGVSNNIIGDTLGNFGNVIYTSDEGLYLSNSVNNYISANIFGMSVDEATPFSSAGRGIYLAGSSKHNIVGGLNVGAGNIIGNYNDAIYISGADSNRVYGNLLGLNSSNAVRSNSRAGIYISGSNATFIGDTLPNARNVISANSSYGLYIGNAQNTIIRGNYIGTTTTATASLGSQPRGIYLIAGSTNTFIGDLHANARNIISGNTAQNIEISSNSNSNFIYNNFIGVDITGNTAISGNGVGIELAAKGNHVGNGSGLGRNVISGNSGYAILISDSLNIINENYIGVGTNSFTPVPNLNTAIYVNGVNGSNQTIINNIIANNGDAAGERGIRLENNAIQQTRISGNLIHDNFDSAISRTPLAQNNIPVPLISYVGLDSTVYGTSAPNAEIELYADNLDEAEYFAGQTTADGSGNWSIPNVDLAVATNLTALQIDGQNNTSILSAPVASIGVDPFIVTTVSDHPDSIGSLRFAISQSNLSSAVDTITFALAPNSTIVIDSTLAADSAVVIIDESALNITIQASGSFTGQFILALGESGRVENLSFDGNNLAPAAIKSEGTTGGVYDNLNIFNNLQAGILISDGDTLQNSHIYSNTAFGAGNLSDSKSQSYLINNRIGTNAAGNVSAGNQKIGVSANDYLVMINNTISGNDSIGVVINGNDVELYQNRIGVDHSTGLSPVANQHFGIYVDETRAQIGDGTQANANIIAAATDDTYGYGIGIFIAADSTDVLYNNIGLAVDGSTPVGNRHGIRIESSNNTITNNFVSSNLDLGIHQITATSGNYYAYNIIGYATDTITDRGNGDSAMLMEQGSNNVVERNLFANSGLNGLHLGVGSINEIFTVGNVFHNNAANDIQFNVGVQGNIQPATWSTVINDSNAVSGVAGLAANNLVALYIDSTYIDTVRTSSGGMFTYTFTNQDLTYGDSIRVLYDDGSNTANFSAGNSTQYLDPLFVTSTSDANVLGTLRYAVTTANGNVGPDTIRFDVSLVDSTIALGSPLTLTDASTVINGDIDNDSLPSVRIETATGSTNIFQLTTDATTIEYLNLAKADQAINVLSGSSFNRIRGNYIGTTLNGLDTLGSLVSTGIKVNSTAQYEMIGDTLGNHGNVIVAKDFGVDLYQANNVHISGNIFGMSADESTDFYLASAAAIYLGESKHNTIGSKNGLGGNIIAGTYIGISIDFGADSNLVASNLIGLNSSDFVHPNFMGIRVVNAQNNTIGDTTAVGSGNVISGNTNNGIRIDVGSISTLIQNNLIGTNIAGTASAGAQQIGVNVTGNAAETVIGGYSPNASNIISGNNFGVLLGSSHHNSILYNVIGLDINGTNAVPNTNVGLSLSNTTNSFIGDVNYPNFISGNTNTAISMSGADSLNHISGNYIGVQIDGTTAAPNGGHGIEILGSLVKRDTIYSNVIANNGTDPSEFGIYMDGTSSNIFISDNSIYNNFGGAIQTNGANDGIFAPTISIFNLDSSLVGTGLPSQSVDIYLDNGNQGEFYSQTVFADGSGNWSIPNFDPQGYAYITALQQDSLGNTSEFSAAVLAVPTNPLLVTRADIDDVDTLGTLRYALNYANNNIGPDTIRFANALTGASVTVNSTLNIYGSGTVIRGDLESQDSIPRIQLLASSPNYSGIHIQADSVTISFLSLAGFGNSGNMAAVFVDHSPHAILQDNIIGLDLDGTSVHANHKGVYALAANNILFGDSANVDLGNVISGNWDNGIELRETEFARIRNNIIGLDATGAVIKGNGFNGLLVDSASNYGIIANNTISGNSADGIRVRRATNTTIVENIVGLDNAGYSAMANNAAGIHLSTFANYSLIDNNLISGNGTDGIFIFSDQLGTNTYNNTILRNGIGISGDGVTAVGNLGNGIVLQGGAENTNIGNGSADGANVISGNGQSGIRIGTTLSLPIDQNTISFNYIGTDTTKSSNIGNGQNGVYVLDSVYSSGLSFNTITNNTNDGIRIVGTGVTNVSHFLNSIYSNGFSAIAVTAGANANVQPPIITSFTLDSMLSGTAAPNNYVAIHADLQDEAEIFVDTLQADGAGNWSIKVDPAISTNLTAYQIGAGSSGLSAPMPSVLQDPLVVTRTTDANVFGSFRYALDVANSNAGPDTIRFSPSIQDSTIHINGNLNITDNNTVINGDINGDNTPSIRLLETSYGAVFFNIQSDSNHFEFLNVAGGGTAFQFTSRNNNMFIGNYIGTTLNGLDTAGSSIIGNAISGSGNYTLVGDTAGVYGNVISAQQSAVQLSSGSNNIVAGNIIGLSADESVSLGGTTGVRIVGGSPNNRIGGSNGTAGNIIGNMSSYGIEVQAPNTTIYGNLIGLNSFDIAHSNAIGIRVTGSFTTIGDTLPAGRNIISANTSIGIQFFGSGANYGTVQNNYIGTTRNGSFAASIEQSSGISIANNANNILIGGSSVNSRNVISGNASGVVTNFANNISLYNNIIGMNALGSAPVPNSGVGLNIISTTESIIGDRNANFPNYISGNGNSAIHLQNIDSLNIIAGNYIGLQVDGITAEPNSGHGIEFSGSVVRDSIFNNTIAYNGANIADHGIYLSGSQDRISFYNNSIFNNVGDGIRTNGANSGITPPTITAYFLDSTLTGTSNPNAQIELYHDNANEGELAFLTTTADGSGNWSFTNVDPAGFANFTAIQTDLVGNSSNFSAPLAATPIDPLIVTSTADVNTIGTLRFAVNEANSNIGADTIVFSPSIQDSTIVLGSNLIITDNSTVINGDIDGDSLPSIIIKGLGQAYDGLVLNSNSNSIEFVNIVGFQNGINISGINNDVISSFFGTSLDGLTASAFSNTTAVRLFGDNNKIGVKGSMNYPNVFGNNNDAIYVNSSARNHIANNIIGLNRDFSSALPNTNNGITIINGVKNQIGSADSSGPSNVIAANLAYNIILNGADSTYVINNNIGQDLIGSVAYQSTVSVNMVNAQNLWLGDTIPNTRNNITNNGNNPAVSIAGNVGGLKIANAYIGLDYSGINVLGDISNGIQLLSSTFGNVNIGLSDWDERVIIASASAAAIEMNQTAGDSVFVNGVVLGNNNSGSMMANASFGNTYGIRLANNVSNVFIGDTINEFDRNWIMHSVQNAIDISGADNVKIINNNIGVNNSSVEQSNTKGIFLTNDSRNVLIASNLIQGNALEAIHVLDVSSDSILIVQNKIFNNSNGINFSNQGNANIQAPSISYADEDSTVFGTSAPNAIIELFADDANQGRYFLASTSANGLGDWSIPNVDLTQAANLTATQDSLGRTSAFSAPVASAPTNPLIVTSTSDNNTIGTLRFAVNEANSNIGADTIVFSPSIQDSTIVLGSNLIITDNSTVINGDIDGNLTPSIRLVSISGSGTIFTVNSDSNALAWLNIANTGTAIDLDNNASGNQIYGNFIGVTLNGQDTTNSAVNLAVYSFGTNNNNIIGDTLGNHGNVITTTGDAIVVNGLNNHVSANIIGMSNDEAIAFHSAGIHAILLAPNSNNNTIGGLTAGAGNIIGNYNQGIYFQSSDSNRIYGNLIGLNSSDVLNPISGYGITLGANSDGNFVGDTLATARNILSNNSAGGILIQGTSNLIRGNFIGTNIAGTAAASLGQNNGIRIEANSNIIGGSESQFTRNIISNNTTGIFIVNAENTQIENNYLGLDVTGTSAIAGSGIGIILNDARYTRIGSDKVNGSNFVSGHSSMGIRFDGVNDSLNVVTNNYIGLQADGSSALGNGEHGIELINAASRDSIYNNVIWNNGNSSDESGISISSTVSQIYLSQNSLRDNFFTAINLFAPAQNNILAPVINSYLIDSVLSGTADPNNSVEIFADNALQAQQFITTVTADGSGNWSLPSADAQGFTNFTAMQRDAAGNSSALSEPLSATPTDPLIVTSTSDTDSIGTLRYAMNYANSNLGVDIITFGISNATIVVDSTLTLNEAGNAQTIIDGQSNNIVIEASGSFPSGDVALLTVQSPFQVIRNLELNGAGKARHGIFFNGSGNGDDGKVENLYVHQFENGVVGEAVRDSVINSNISQNTNSGVGLGPFAYVEGNTIGTNAAGNLGFYGQKIGLGLGDYSTALNNTISGNDSIGVYIVGYQTTLLQNKIGTNTAGTTAIPNNSVGISVVANGGIIGDGTAFNANIISGNSSFGVVLENVDSVHVSNNIIGLNVSENSAIANGVGIEVRNNSRFLNIKKNVISGNSGWALNLSGSRFMNIDSNYIGTDKSLTQVVGNQSTGILINDNARNISFSENVVANNLGHAVQFADAFSDSVRYHGNSIFNNTSGIENSQNANGNVTPPTITSILQDSTVLGTTFPFGKLQLFVDNSDQGQFLLDTITADGAGNFSFSNVDLSQGTFLTAMVDSAERTSAFSTPFMIEFNASIEIPLADIDFGTIPYNTSIQDTITIYNTGNAELLIDSVSFDGLAFGQFTDLAPVGLNPVAVGDSIKVPVAFMPTAVGSYGDSVIVYSNAVNAPIAKRYVYGIGQNYAPYVSSALLDATIAEDTTSLALADLNTVFYDDNGTALTYS
jgi:hypothetical protein